MNLFFPYPYDPLYVSGATAHAQQFIKNFEALGHRIFTSRGDAARGDPGYPKRRIDRWRFLRSVDVIYERLEHRAPGGGWYRAYGRWSASPVIAWEFNTVPEYGTVLGQDEASIKHQKARLLALARYCDVAFCVSQAIEDYVRRELRIQNAVTVPNGSDVSRFSPTVQPVKRIAIDNADLKVIWIGSASIGWHDFDLLRRAAWRLHDEPPARTISFHVVGPGFSGAGEMPPSVHYHGAIPYQDVPRWLSGADVGLVLYRRGPADFSSPLKLYDYLASGLAVVATDQPQARSVLQELDQGDCLIEEGDDRHLARLLSELANDKPKVAKLGMRGRELVESKYTWAHNARRIENELVRLVSQHRPGRLP